MKNVFQFKASFKNRLPYFILSCSCILVLTNSAVSQGTKDDYRRAAELRQKYSKGFRATSASHYWHTDKLMLSISQNGETKHQIIDSATGKLLDSGKTGSPLQLEPLASQQKSSSGGNQVTITFANDFERPIRLFWITNRGDVSFRGVIKAGEETTVTTHAGHSWLADFTANDLAGIFVAATQDCYATFNEESRTKCIQRTKPNDLTNPRSESRLLVRQNNLWLDKQGVKAVQLTTNGSAEDRYLRRFHYNSDRSFALAFQETKVKKRKIPLVESSPKGQVQPEIKWITYVKPGDELPQRRPTVVDIENSKAIPVDESLFGDSWSVQFKGWSEDNRNAYVLFNQRGHQRLALFSINAQSGEVKKIIDEKSKTFVDYSQKTMLHWLDGKKQILWASERDGWNHLYLIDTESGEVINQVTQGNWVVRNVEFVDQENQVVWFTAMGIHPDQDPYHKHLARVNFDGSGLKNITSGDGTHSWEFSPDRKYLIDKWSRVDQAPTWELLRASDGRTMRTLWSKDIEELKNVGYRPPLRFSSPGRDGETQIYGYIIQPSNFDPTKKYPVIEDIYAGPHDHHVGKSFGLQIRDRMLTELGFVVVRIDGMGTNWRSKKFHDVCWQNLADGGLPDRIAWIQAAAEKYSWMDLSKVGIFGGSAGGQNCLAALLHHGDFYNAAVSDCGCHDNRMDKIWWNEAWMGRIGPHYRENSNVTHAHKLNGDLMLTVGELDSNVDPSSTMQVVDALIRANKDFDLVVVPGAGHGVGETPYLVRRRQDFFVRKLLQVEPRN